MMTEDHSLDQSSTSQNVPEFCSYGAPYAAMIKDAKSTLFQTCCNHWDCQKCSQKMAALVRSRVVYGAESLAGRGLSLFFWTFTCRGRDLELDTADEHYYEWTNRALARLRAQARREKREWVYVQVTERQSRGAAHSHFIITFSPDDGIESVGPKGYVQIASASFVKAVVASGLGVQCQITRINSPGAVASYISGYLTKHATKDTFPKGWKRVRWSRDWPDLPPLESDYTQVLQKRSDWDRADRKGVTFIAENEGVYQYARRHMVHVV